MEVDSLLSGELPVHIVQSFAGRKRDWDDPRTPNSNANGGEEDRPAWDRHTSAWKLKKKRDSIDNILGEGVANLNLDLNDEERDVGSRSAGEGTALLGKKQDQDQVEDSEQREARREKIARLALNSEFTSMRWWPFSPDTDTIDSQYHCQYPTGSSQGCSGTLLGFHLAYCFTGRLGFGSTEYIHHPGN
jgi:hypothetical protein